MFCSKVIYRLMDRESGIDKKLKEMIDRQIVKKTRHIDGER